MEKSQRTAKALYKRYILVLTSDNIIILAVPLHSLALKGREARKYNTTNILNSKSFPPIGYTNKHTVRINYLPQGFINLCFLFNII